MARRPDLVGYEILERLHTSERSCVCRARRISDGERVVVKCSAPGVLAEEAFMRYVRERELLDALDSEGVIRAHDVVKRQEAAAIVLEDIGGSSLDVLLRRGPVPLATVIEIGQALARALRDVHAADIVHRDINPHNVVYNPATGATRIVDFGLATRSLVESSSVHAPAGLAGTLAYIAPEQTGRMNRRVDSRADLYSLGVTLYELLTGSLPCDSEDPAAVVHFHLALEPPSVRAADPSIPEVVADIVAKLLAKAPERRYQTAAGLEADLAECAARLAATGTVASFAIATHDLSDRFELPDAIYGREAPIGALVDAFGRAARGAAVTVLVSGYSGVGKTSIVRELAAPVKQRNGYFAAGRFDLLWRDVSFRALVAALEDLVEQLLTEGEEEIARWRERILAAVPAHGQVLVDALPSLELILGPQPPLPPLDSAAALNRFCLTVQRFMQVLARREHPLVLFLDDVQWADGGSLGLLRSVATAADTEALLIVAAYRDNEVKDGHALALAVEELERRGGLVERVAVTPLPRQHVVELVAAALRQEPAEVAALADIVLRKTDGNPFFIRQFLQALHAEKGIRLDAATRRFVFDLASIEGASITDNVVDILTHNLLRLPVSTQRIVTLAALIGGRFDLEMLAAVAGLPLEAVYDELEPATAAGLVVPLSEPEYFCDAQGRPWLICRRFGFEHDRIQETARAQLPRSEQERVHAVVGRALLARTEAAGADEQLFDIVHHLSRGLALIVDPAERARVADLALQAGARARDAGAYEVAVGCYRTAVRLRAWSEDYRAAYQAHCGLAESLHLQLDFVGALEVLEEAVRHITSSRDFAGLEALKTNLYLHKGDIGQALECCRQAAHVLGVELPEDPEALHEEIGLTLARILDHTDGVAIETLIDLPSMTDPDKLAFMTLAMSCMPGAYQAEPALFLLLAATQVALSIAHGNCAESAHAYASFGAALHSMGRDDDSVRFGRLGRDLVRRRDDRRLLHVVGFLYSSFTGPWCEPIEHAVKGLRDATGAALDAGDYSMASYAGSTACVYALWKGTPLDELEAEAERHLKLTLETGEAGTVPVAARTLDLARTYRSSLDADVPASSPASGVEAMTLAPRFIDRLLLIEGEYMLGDAARALAIADEVLPLLSAVPGFFVGAIYRFFHCLAATACWGETGDEGREQMIAANQLAMKRWADRCPANFLAMYLLVEAEHARVGGQPNSAVELYDQAIAAASQHGLVKLEALGYELAGRFWLGRKKREIALVHLRHARQLYAQWGAHRKVQLLDRELQTATPASTLGHGVASQSLSGHASEALDLATVLKAARAISGEIVLDRLLTVMMEIILENAGAQAGALLLYAGGQLVERACKRAEARAVTIYDAAAGGDIAWIPPAVLNYVVRRRESVVIDDAAGDARFGGDAVVRERRPRSILCTPIRHKSVLTGLLYLENNLVGGAFTRARLEALNILVAQIAVSIENATLFAKQKEHADALAAYRDHLAELVAERTKELTDANRRILDESIAREQMEIELRLAQRLQTVGQLAAGVAHEINTPMQYVGSNLEFVNKAFGDVLGLLDHYRAVLDLNQELREQAADPKRAKKLAFLRKQVPPALEQALEGVKRVTEIVAAMKAFSHPGQKDKALTNVNEAIQNTLVVGKNEYKYVADVETELGELPLVMSHVGEINQVLLNLIVNAAHAIGDVVAGTTNRGTIRVATRLEGAETIVIAVSDSGCGIPDAIRDRIFDPFFTTKQVGKGTGQGLAIARSVVDRHGGTLTFDSEVGKGTTFYVRLPTTRPPTAEAPAVDAIA